MTLMVSDVDVVDDPSNTDRIFACPFCFVRCYPPGLWRRMGKTERRVSGGRAAAAGMCTRCSRYPEQRPPRPGDELVEPKCEDCGGVMVSRGQWARAGEAERAELLEEGYLVESALGLCGRDRSRRDRELGIKK